MSAPLDSRCSSVATSSVEWSESCVTCVTVIDVDAVADREVDAGDVASSGCKMEDRLPQFAADHDIGAMLDEAFHELLAFGPLAVPAWRVVMMHGEMKDRPSVVAFGVDVCAGTQVVQSCSIVRHQTAEWLLCGRGH